MARLFTGIRKSFVAGVFLVLPAVVTAYILVLGFRLLGAAFRPIVDEGGARFGFTIHPAAAAALSLVLTVAVLVLLGFAGRSFVGRRIVKAVDALALRIPLAKTLYAATKRLVEAFTAQKAFQQVVLVQWPRKDCWCVGFCAGNSGPLFGKAAGEDLVSVFVPTTPNPTSGYLVLVPSRDIRPMDISLEQGATFVMSGGVVAPGAAPADGEPG
jgi:uncharacterized membrane protein